MSQGPGDSGTSPFEESVPLPPSPLPEVPPPPAPTGGQLPDHPLPPPSAPGIDWSQSGPSPTYQPLPQRPSNSAGTWSLILGILGLVCLGPLAGVPAIILGNVGRNKAKQGLATNGGIATAGFWLGIVGTALTGMIILFSVLPSLRL